MARYLVPSRSKGSFGIAVCDRCGRKVFESELSHDPNAPGLLVCKDDLDVLDPYRLPSRQTESATLPLYRPDVALTFGDYVIQTEPSGAPGSSAHMVTETSGGDDVFIRRGIRTE